MKRYQPHPGQQAQASLPFFFDDEPPRRNGKTAREIQRRRERLQREEDVHIMELADYHCPFMEA